MSNTKKEYEPLLEYGIHDISQHELRRSLLDLFSRTKRREELVDRFIIIFDELKSISFNFRIWVDGSFVTKKLDPGDIDLLLIIDYSEVNSLSGEHQKKLAVLSNRSQSKIRYYCDIITVDCNDDDNFRFWSEWFCTSREKVPKGVFQISNSI